MAWWAHPGGPGGSILPVAQTSSTGTEPVRPAPSTLVPPRRTSAPLAAGRPTRIVINRIGVDVPVVPVAAEGNTLTPPSNPQELGWWSAGAKPGEARGSALLTGHTVHTGGGALDHLASVRVGDPVVVQTTRGVVSYTVTSVRSYTKGSIATGAQRLFSQQVTGRLVVVTCGDWNGTEYLSNVVVTATPRR